MPHTPDSSRALLPSARLTRWGVRLLPVVAHILREDADLLTRWRARLTAAFLGASATLGLLPAIPTLTVGIARGMWMLVAVDLTALLITFYLLLSRRVGNQLRGLFLTSACFGIGVMSVVFRGPGSTVLGWLFMSVFLSAFLLGPRATTWVVLGILGVLGGVALAIARAWMPWAQGDPLALNEWLLTSVNFAFLIVVFAIANGIIIRLLETEDRARARAERRLREARHNEALGTLAGGIAHDFNNLLVPVLANVEAVRRSLPPGSDDDTALHDAQRSALRARDLVQRILTFGRGMRAERHALDLVPATREVLELSRLSLPAGVRLELHHDATPLVHASAAEVHQIVANLITNAVHAVGERGRIEVRIDTARSSRGPRARLRVRDDGMGMDARTRERLFDPYFSTKEPGRGTGLGLPIVHSVVTSLGGRIDVDSHPGRGTTFTVLLPEIEQPAGITASTEAALPDERSVVPPPTNGVLREPAPGTRVLLVDDEPSVRRAATRLLESLGCLVTGAANAGDALAHARRATDGFDVLVTDYRMPGGSGTELVAAIRSEAGPLPAVLISGHLDDATDDGPLQPDIVLLAKPFTREALAQALLDADQRARPGSGAEGTAPPAP